MAEPDLEPTSVKIEDTDTSSATSQDLVLRNSGSLDSEKAHEGLPDITLEEALDGFKKRRFRIGVFQKCRVLFDTTMLPGVTPQEGIDFLLKGLKVEPEEEANLRQFLNPETAKKIREYFPSFIESIKQQNNDQTVDDIWRAVDGDPIKKLSLQWQIQGEQLMDDYIESDAAKEEARLRKLDKLLRDSAGKEFMVRYHNLHSDIDFCGLVIPDGSGLQITQPDELLPYRELVIPGQAAFTQEHTHLLEQVETAPNLNIPFKARKAFNKKDDSILGNLLYSSPDTYEEPFRDDFIGVLIGEEIDKVHDSYTYNNKDIFRNALHREKTSISPA